MDISSPGNYSDDNASGDNLEEFDDKDYQHIPELDVYEGEGLDEEDYSDISAEGRVRAEQMIDERKT